MSWINRVRKAIPFIAKKEQTAETLWHKCPSCSEMLFIKEWEDNRARIFFVKQPLREAYANVDKVTDYLDQRTLLNRQDLWAAELAIHKLLLELEKEDGDRGFVYYQLLNLIRYGLEVTQKVLAG